MMKNNKDTVTLGRDIGFKVDEQSQTLLET